MQINSLLVEKKQLSLLSPSNFSFLFSPKTTLIKSNSNSVGKTTLLRFILHSLGFIVPSTHGIRMSDYYVTIDLENSTGRFLAKRNDYIIALYEYNGNPNPLKEYNVSKSEQRRSFQRFIFEIDGMRTIDNILGSFFIDQEIGWKLGPRGKVTGNIDFDCQELAAGLTPNEELANLEQEINRLRSELNKYHAINKVLSLNNKTKDTQTWQGTGVSNASENENTRKRSMLLSQISYLEKRRRTIKNTLEDNERAADMVESFRIPVLLPGQEKPVVLNRNMIAAFPQNQNILRAQLFDIEASLHDARINLKELTPFIDPQETLFEVRKISDEAYKVLSEANINPLQLQALIKETKSELEKKNKHLSDYKRSTQTNYSELRAHIYAAFSKFNIDERKFESMDILSQRFNFRFSGIELRDICFAYRLGIHAFMKAQGIKLPFIIDSPGSGERISQGLQELIQKTLEFAPDDQIIISSACSIDEKQFEHLIIANGKIFEGEYEEKNNNGD